MKRILIILAMLMAMNVASAQKISHIEATRS